MKAIGYKAVMLILIVLALPMIIPGPDGKPIMSFRDWLPADFFKSLGRAAAKLESKVDTAQNGAAGTTIYSWVDEQGVRHYADALAQSVSAESAEAVQLSTNHNTLPPPQTTLLEDALKAKRSGSPDSTSLQKLEALVGGDYAKAPELVKHLPELLEQSKQARQIERKVD